MPQCVINKGPVSESLVPAIFTTTFSTVTPISEAIVLPGILKVNNEGTGDSIVWPNFFSHSNCDDFE